MTVNHRIINSDYEPLNIQLLGALNRPFTGSYCKVPKSLQLLLIDVLIVTLSNVLTQQNLAVTLKPFIYSYCKPCKYLQQLGIQVLKVTLKHQHAQSNYDIEGANLRCCYFKVTINPCLLKVTVNMYLSGFPAYF